MRTTLTLEPDVVLLLEEEQHRLRKPWKAVVNDALRRGLTAGRPARRKGRYRLPPHRANLLPGIDPLSMNRLADELEELAIVPRKAP